MSEERQIYPREALNKFRQWHFWWLVIFSFLLIVVFVYYLPTRFLQQVGAPHDAMSIDESQPHGHDASGASIPNTSPSTADHGEMMMNDEEMHTHMDEHMTGGMSMDEMMAHMAEEHGMTAEESNQIMNEMMPARQSLGDGGMDNHQEDEHIEDGHEAAYFDEGTVKNGLAVNLNISPTPFNTGVPLSMNFFVNQKPGNLPDRQAGIPVLANKLQVEHEKLMHVIGVRSDMNEFFHIHPEFLADNPSIFSIDHIFDKPGSYKIWSEIKSEGVNYSFGHPEVNVNGSGLREEKKVSFSRNIIVGNYQISMEMGDVAVKGREVDLSFDIHTLTGQEVGVEQYLGADMHLSIISDDRKQFIHTHPVDNSGHSHSNSGIISTVYAHGEEEPAGVTDEHQTTPSMDSGQASSGDEVISFQVTFPEVGLYKVFAQFRPKNIDLTADQALLAEFWIQVEGKAALPISQWWMLLIISIILIAGLSWWVNNYLKVKPEDVKVKS